PFDRFSDVAALQKLTGNRPGRFDAVAGHNRRLSAIIRFDIALDKASLTWIIKRPFFTLFTGHSLVHQRLSAFSDRRRATLHLCLNGQVGRHITPWEWLMLRQYHEAHRCASVSHSLACVRPGSRLLIAQDRSRASRMRGPIAGGVTNLSALMTRSVTP